MPGRAAWLHTHFPADAVCCQRWWNRRVIIFDRAGTIKSDSWDGKWEKAHAPGRGGSLVAFHPPVSQEAGAKKVVLHSEKSWCSNECRSDHQSIIPPILHPSISWWHWGVKVKSCTFPPLVSNLETWIDSISFIISCYVQTIRWDVKLSHGAHGRKVFSLTSWNCILSPQPNSSFILRFLVNITILLWI